LPKANKVKRKLPGGAAAQGGDAAAYLGSGERDQPSKKKTSTGRPKPRGKALKGDGAGKGKGTGPKKPGQSREKRGLLGGQAQKL